jgi:hypothetical protein
LCLVSVTIILLHDFVFAGSPELFKGAGKIWTLLYQLSLAFVASYIFFYVVVHIRRLRDKENIRRFLRERVEGIVGYSDRIASALKRSTGHDFEGQFPSRSDVDIMCSALGSASKAPALSPVTGAEVTWAEFLQGERNVTARFIADIYATIPLLDTELLLRVMDVSDCTLFRFMDHGIFEPVPVIGLHTRPNVPLQIMAASLQEYFQAVRRLAEYKERNLG